VFYLKAMRENPYPEKVTYLFRKIMFRLKKHPAILPAQSAMKSPVEANLEGIKDWWISSDNP
jgi:hypothetical protein